jgi:hypothetical protein
MSPRAQDQAVDPVRSRILFALGRMAFYQLLAIAAPEAADARP